MTAQIDTSRVLSRFSDMSVLIVDDSPANVTLLERLLRHHGIHRLHGQTDSRAVAGDLAEHRPDLVLLDMRMPHLDGHAVLQQIQQHAAGAYLPVLVLTADTSTETRDRGLAAGAQDFLTKPIDTREAVLRIANLLQTRQLYATLRASAPHGGQDAPPVPQPIADQELTRQRILATLAQRRLHPHYQAVVDTSSGRTVGVEGLTRFLDADPPGPASWFADAFAVGLGVELEWLAAAMLVPALSLLDPQLFLAVNMSPATVLRLLDEQLVPPALCPRLVIELTEHVPVEDYLPLHRATGPLREAGMRLACDDLGAGYAGFRHLLLLDPDIIKLDISLVAGIDASKPQRALAAALVTFAGDVGAQVIAEGVETPGELAAVRDLGISWAQGFHLHRPAPDPPTAVAGRDGIVARATLG